MKQSHYLSGITEQSIEESDFAVSVENPNAKFTESNAQEKRLAISKITVNSEAEPKRDSIAFLYDKFKEHFDKNSDGGSDTENYPISMSPFKIVDQFQAQETTSNSPKSHHSSKSQKSKISSAKVTPRDIQPTKISHTNLLNPLDSQNQHTHFEGDHEENYQNYENHEGGRYSNFRQGSKGILTIDEL